MFRTFMMLYFMLKHVIWMKKKLQFLYRTKYLENTIKMHCQQKLGKIGFLLSSIKLVRRKGVSQKIKWWSFIWGKNELFFILLDNLNTKKKVNYLVKYRITSHTKNGTFCIYDKSCAENFVIHAWIMLFHKKYLC